MRKRPPSRFRSEVSYSAVQLLGSLRNGAALIAGASEFVFGRLAAAVGTGDRGGAVGGAARHLIEFHLAGKTIIHADDDHAEMKQVSDDRKQRGFLAAMLDSGRGEGAIQGLGVGGIRYAASTSTSSESSSAVMISFVSSRIATPSRALTPMPLTSTLPAAGTR